MPQDTELLRDWEYEFDADLAQALMQADPKLARMRFLLVPYKVKEDPFWKNYFARIYIIKSTIMDPTVTPNMNRIQESLKPAVPQHTTKTLPPERKVVAPTPVEAKPKIEDESDGVREEQLKKELEDLGEDFDLDLDDLDLDDASADVDLDFDDPDLDLILNG